MFNTILSIICSSLALPGQFAIIKGDGQLFTASERSVMVGLPPVERLGFWPDFAGMPQKVWANSRIPSTVLSGATEWAKTVLGSTILPGDLRNRWRGLEGDEATPDLLAARFEADSTAVQIVENGRSLVLLLIPKQATNLRHEDDAKEFIGNNLRTFTKFPAEQISLLRYSLVASGYECLVWSGNIFCGSPKTAEETSWWNYLTVATNGRFVVMRIHEVAPGPTPTNGMAATSGQMSRRFRGGG
jgi:hypothetical protein